MNKQEYKLLFNSDLKRYGGGKKLPLFWSKEIKYTHALRKCQYYRTKRLYKPLYLLWSVYKRCLAYQTHFQIPDTVKIGPGFYIGHFGRVIVNPNAIIGKNVNISTGCTIGGENRGQRKGAPVIGDEVWIGTNAVIVGKINIGSDVMIAPNSFVNFDVPPHSLVIGNPAKIIHKENATEGYINNKV